MSFLLLALFVLSLLGQHTLVVADYSPTTANYLVQMCGAAYCAGHWIDRWDCQACKVANPSFKPYKRFKASLCKLTGIKGFVGYDADRSAIVVSFAGTDPADLRNVLDDLSFLQVDPDRSMPGLCGNSSSSSSGLCSVHEGFLDSYMSVRQQVYDAVRELRQAHPGSTLLMTGHSLGAALTALCALDFAVLQNMPADEVYTYGQPRVGDPRFAKWYQHAVVAGSTSVAGSHWRVTHREDPVPHLPPMGVPEPLSYLHVPQEIFYPSDTFNNNSFKVCGTVDTYEDPTCLDDYAGAWLPDHLNYLSMDFTQNWFSCEL